MTSNKTISNIRSFNRFYTNVLGLFDRHFLESDYSFTEVRIIYEIYHDADSSVRKISKTLGIDEGYLSRTIYRLRQADLVNKTQSKTDRRRYILSLTGKGESECRKLIKKSALSISELLTHLSTDEIAEVESSMSRIQQLLTKSREQK